MPLPLVVQLTSFAMGTFNFGNSLFNLLSNKSSPLDSVVANISEIVDNLGDMKAHLTDIEIEQSLSGHIDAILGLADYYKSTVLPAVAARVGNVPLSDQAALDKLTEIFNGSNAIRSWATEVHGSREGVNSQLNAIHRQMVGSEVNGRPVINAAISRVMKANFNVDSIMKLPANLPVETTRPKAEAATKELDRFLSYTFNVQRIGMGCLLTADLLDPDHRQLPELIKVHKRTFYENISKQFDLARTGFSLIGFLNGSILAEVRRDCAV